MPIVLRQLWHARGYTAASVLTLGLACGAVTVMFSAVQAVLLRPVPMADPSTVLVAWGSNPAVTAGVIELSYLDVRDLGNESRTLASAAAMSASPWPTVLDGSGDPAKLAATGVSGTFFETLGTRAALGRTLTPEDDRPGAPGVVVLSHTLWTARFGADPAIVGRDLTLDDEPARVVGVMPAGFEFPRGTDLWTPAAPVLASAEDGWEARLLRTVGVFYLVGRTRDGTSARAAAEELSAVAGRLQRNANDLQYRIVAERFDDHLYGPARPALWAAMAAVLVLLAIACANVSGLMLTRGALRSRESAVRLALGARRADLVRLWILEALAIAAAGGALGWLAASWALDGVVALAPDGVPGLPDATLDWRVGLVSLVIVATAGLLCAVAPALQAGHADAVDALADGGRTATANRSLSRRAALQVVQTALAVALLLSAGLVVRSAQRLAAEDLGFDPARTLTLSVEPRIGQRPVHAWMDDLIERVSGLPEVERAGAVYLRPLALGPIGQGAQVTLEGQPETPEAARANPLLNYQVATPGYFEAMRIPVLRGRAFTPADTAAAPRVAIVSETTAARLWPGVNPIGKRLRTSTFEFGTGRMAWREVVGVVADVRYRGLREVHLDLYDPAAQTPLPATDLVVRTRSAPLALLEAVEREARALDPRVIISRVATLDAIVDRARAPWRFAAWVFSLFGVLALVLSTVGLASLVALDVASRRQELAIRSALGAPGGLLVGTVVRQGLRRTAAGAAIGVGLALAAARGLDALLVDVTALDGPTYAAVVIVVALVTAVASYLPARRAGTMDPVRLLRQG